MFCHMRAQWFIDTAYVSDLFQITVHPLVTGYRQDHSFFQAFRMCLVLLQNHPWNVQQWNVTHVVRLFPGFSYPVLAIDILYYVFISQVLYIGKGQPGQRRKKHQSKGDGNKENQTERVVKQRFCGCLPLQPNSKERQDNASFPLPSHYLSCYQLKAKKQHS